MTDTPKRPVPQPGILKIAPYVPGRSDTPAGVKLVKLSANESPLGASPRAIEAVREAAGRIEIYPDGSSRELRVALGEVHGLAPERIVCGFGSDDILHLLAQVYLGEGDEAVMSQYGFNVYPIITRGASAEIIMVPETDYRADVDALLAAVTPRTRILFLANPNNPTGTYLPIAEVERLQRGLRPDILFVLDSAYAEYVTAEDYSEGIDLVNASDNVVMVRTFSKMGIAGERVGWMYGPDHVVDAVNRIRGPFNVSLSGQAAAAAAARDVAFTAKLRDHNARWRSWLTAALQSNAIRVPPSQGNFVLALFEDVATAKAAFAALRDKGLLVREMHGYGIPDALRISIGLEEHMRAVVEILKAFGAPGASN
ncbi:histidinol-phosphate transaminase [Devosia insulae DS-56]|uniref:Histidinol-phosphate aminotransferase n=1 Tax=Devosia insulae DS-56 TaxID=1116389 RepID=A0A1E5XMN1_9HYPH|nr:histidinol-phosphate transaminase [Devosia insulae]OEO29870.1 histidinol-phosphate transaminase [Devosia insulae DS-56]